MAHHSLLWFAYSYQRLLFVLLICSCCEYLSKSTSSTSVRTWSYPYYLNLRIQYLMFSSFNRNSHCYYERLKRLCPILNRLILT